MRCQNSKHVLRRLVKSFFSTINQKGKQVLIDVYYVTRQLYYHNTVVNVNNLTPPLYLILD